MENIFAVYKPKGITSHDVIDKLRQETGERKIGHAGTLDPLAEGILVVGVGRDATKHLGDIVAKEKEYVATICFGATSTTDDDEGEKEQKNIASIPTNEDVLSTLLSFKSKYKQTPPTYSAIKVRGEALYKKARRGESFVLEARPALIKEIEILEYEWPILKIRVVTGPGVYIRALARDIGEKLNVGGYLIGLIRTRVGSFTLDQARKINSKE